MIYEGKISYKTSKICLFVIGLAVLIAIRELYIIFFVMLFYMDILIRERLSNATIEGKQVIITKYYLFGVVKKQSGFNLVNEHRTLNYIFRDLPEDAETFGIQSLDEVSKSKITFYIKKAGN